MERGYRFWLLLLRIAVPVVLFAFIFYRIDWAQLWTVVSEVELRWLALALVLQLLAVVVQGSRLYALMSGEAVVPPFWRLQLVNFVAMFFDLFTPGRLGSDAYRVLVFHGRYDPYAMISILVVMRLQGLLVTAVIAGTVGLAIYGAEDWRTLVAFASLSLAVLGTLVLVGLVRVRFRRLETLAAGASLVGRLVQKLLALRTALRTARLTAPPALAAAALGIPFLLVTATIVHVVAHAYDLHLGFPRYVFGTALIVLVSVVPISIHGRGIAEVVALAVWAEPGASPEQVLAVMLTAYVIMLVCSLLAGGCWLLVREAERRRPHAPSQQAE